MHCIEQHLSGKSGNIDACEDAIVVNEHFACVIDGATSKVQRLWDGKSSGKMASLLLAEAVRLLVPDCARDQAISVLTSTLADYYHRHVAFDEVRSDPRMRLAATVALYSRHHREVWIVGDAQCMIDAVAYTKPMLIDQITSSTRAFFLESELARGKTIAELLEHDTGRDLIFPLLERQSLFENVVPASPYGYGVINGFEVPDAYITTIQIAADATELVLASDGYPYLRPTLHESEQELERVLAEDPLCIRLYKSTKGLQQGYQSFDDRAYIRISL